MDLSILICLKDTFMEILYQEECGALSLMFLVVLFLIMCSYLIFDPFSIVAFGLDEAQEPYIASFDGNIYRLQRIEKLEVNIKKLYVYFKAARI